MLRLRYTSFPSVGSCNVLWEWSVLTFSHIQILAIGATGYCILVPEEPSGSQLRQKQVNDVLK